MMTGNDSLVRRPVDLADGATTVSRGAVTITPGTRGLELRVFQGAEEFAGLEDGEDFGHDTLQMRRLSQLICRVLTLIFAAFAVP